MIPKPSKSDSLFQNHFYELYYHSTFFLQIEEEEQEQIDDEEEDLGERYVEYDSEENEVSRFTKISCFSVNNFK